MSDRRAEAFAVLTSWEQTASVRRLSDITGVDRLVVRSLAAHRSALTRHHAGPPHLVAGWKQPMPLWCVVCLEDAPCPDETDAINAVLGVPDE